MDSIYYRSYLHACFGNGPELPHKKAVWIGGLSGFVYLTGIEFLDAHSAKWGWSWGDIVRKYYWVRSFYGPGIFVERTTHPVKFSFHKNTYSDPMLEERADSLYGRVFTNEC